jgi:alkaline phosphatase
MKRPATWSRRSLLGGVGIAAAGLALPGCERAAGGAASGSVGSAGTPRNIILMISDGMSLGVPSLAEPFSRLVRGRSTCWHGLLQDPRARHTLAQTDSLSGMVTDSSAAATALSTGQRCRNGKLNWLGEGQTLTPLADRLIPRGVRIGLVTTDEVCGATPAGFAAVAEKRSDDKAIAPQYRERVDVLLGGGRGAFDPLLRDDGIDLLGEYATRGHRLLLERGDVLRAPEPAKRVLGLFARRQLPYTIDHRHDEADR